MKKKQYLLVLHTHMPYVLYSEVAYWLYEAVLDSYLPFLFILYKLHIKGVSVKITVNISPILLVQLQSEDFKRGFDSYLELRVTILQIALKSHKNTACLHRDINHFYELLAFYRSFNSDVLEIYRYFIKINYLHLLTSAVTHPFLSTMQAFPRLLDLQISLGKKITTQIFSDVSGFWPPECSVFPELPFALKKHHISHFFGDHTAVLFPDNTKSNNIFQSHNVFYILRDYDSTMKIWDQHSGYPAYPLYRDFYSDISYINADVMDCLKTYKIPLSNISIHAISDKNSYQKNLYDYHCAYTQSQKDADDYFSYLESLSHNYIPVFFDMELFGHWWKEGLDFLGRFFITMDTSPCLEMINFNDLSLNDVPIQLPRLSTWGSSANAESWINKDTSLLWEQIVAYNLQLESLLNQTCINRKECDMLYRGLLLHASDWLFLISKNSFRDLSNRILSQCLDSTFSIQKEDLLYTILLSNYTVS